MSLPRPNPPPVAPHYSANKHNFLLWLEDPTLSLSGVCLPPRPRRPLARSLARIHPVLALLASVCRPRRAGFCLEAFVLVPSASNFLPQSPLLIKSQLKCHLNGLCRSPLKKLLSRGQLLSNYTVFLFIFFHNAYRSLKLFMCSFTCLWSVSPH